MAPSPLMADQTLFSDPDIFETTHLLEVFNYRDPQVKNLAFALRPAFLAEREVTTADLEAAFQVSRHLHVATVVRSLSAAKRGCWRGRAGDGQAGIRAAR